MTDAQQTQVPTGRVENVHIDRVVPYWRNPRNISQEAVSAVAKSIEEFGYAQPIVVDSKYEIVIGHTRYAALRKLGHEEISVVVVDHLGPNAVKQLRVIDNRAGEFSLWDYNKLAGEIEHGSTEFLAALFPEMAHLGEAEAGHTLESVEQLAGERHEDWDAVDMEVEFTCPMCFESWAVELTRDAIMSGKIAAPNRKDA